MTDQSQHDRLGADQRSSREGRGTSTGSGLAETLRRGLISRSPWVRLGLAHALRWTERALPLAYDWPVMVRILRLHFGKPVGVRRWDPNDGVFEPNGPSPEMLELEKELTERIFPTRGVDEAEMVEPPEQPTDDLAFYTECPHCGTLIDEESHVCRDVPDGDGLRVYG